MKRVLFMSFLLLFFVADIMAQKDSVRMDTLGAVEVIYQKQPSAIVGSINTTMKWDLKNLTDLPKIMGNADPMHYTQSLPGVQTCSEYTTGIYVQGCDNAHNYVSIDNVPLYNVGHLLGFFSVFNASHFSGLQLTKSAHSSDFSNRLGASLDMHLVDTLSSSFHGDLVVGPISSQGTFVLPIGKKSDLRLSLRSAYLNLLYGQWLKFDGSQLKYDFSDYNLTYSYHISKKDKLCLNLYYGYDKLGLEEASDVSTFDLNWKNHLVSLKWDRRFVDWTMTHQLYNTRYSDDLFMSTTSYSLSVPAYINDFGYRGIVKNGLLKIGADVVFHYIQPQDPTPSDNYVQKKTSQERQNTQEYSLFTDIHKRLFDNLYVDAGVRGVAYFTHDDGHYESLNPSSSLTYYTNGFGRLRLHYGMLHQYLFQSGFSNFGMPTEFWYSCSKTREPQKAHSFSFSYDLDLFKKKYAFSFETYYKKLYQQEEYVGNVLDFVSSNYKLENSTIKGDGENYGVNLMFSKKTGRLTGWVGYSYGRAFRTFEELDSQTKYPANHERIHELNIMATCLLGRRWHVGSTFVLASGTPFTAISNLYLLNEQILAQYGEHNACRLPLYKRLDLSVSYDIKKGKKFEHGINVSVYNLLRSENDLYYRIKIYKGRFAYKPIRFVTDILPSINYYIKF